MRIREEYVINEKTVLLTGEYDCNGKLITRVIDGGETFLVDLTPAQVIDASLLLVGSDLRAALQSSKKLLGPLYMYPLNVNSGLGIYLLPTHSMKKRNCVWISLIHVKNAQALGVRKTKVYTSYGHIIEIDMRKSAFINRVQIVKDLREKIIKNSSSPLIYYIESQNGFYISEDPSTNKYKFIK
ncbi:competence protein ComK [Neobacillus drentensis]|uniref:competence protein ComK n=1 Tax=Neobacillus drentensis TaxID=220684 RepID=UPI0028587C47|nr:competence protein ComK [Neobacillus drentensis]MDR7240499.1 competence protein ComK [Neobacillus drentensis]